MKKILIATTSEATNTDLSNALSQYEVYTCSTGTAVLDTLDILQPDILILDLMLPTIGGLTVLRKSKFRPPIILARTNLIDEFVLQAASDVGVQDILLIPCTTRHILDHLDTLAEKVPSLEV